MDLLERARALAACPLFGALAPAVLVRLAERARAETIEAGERRSTDGTVWVVASGGVAGAATGTVFGVIRIVRPVTPALELVADRTSTLIALAADDVRDIFEEDPVALAALADRLAGELGS
jgi:hypothetical protein